MLPAAIAVATKLRRESREPAIGIPPFALASLAAQSIQRIIARTWIRYPGSPGMRQGMSDSGCGPCGSLHVEGLARPAGVGVVNEGVEAGLPVREVLRGVPGEPVSRGGASTSRTPHAIGARIRTSLPVLRASR
jgi:hypothetical protein